MLLLGKKWAIVSVSNIAAAVGLFSSKLLSTCVVMFHWATLIDADFGRIMECVSFPL